jgi:hypothetical protein
MNFDDIQNMWQEDCRIDEADLDAASRDIPLLHAKYMKLFSDYCFKRKEAEIRLKQIRRKKFEYYSGKAEPEDYRDNPFDLKILKSDLPLYIESDPEIEKYQLKMEMFEIIINYLEGVIKMLNNRTYQIKNMIEWRRFVSGMN